MDTNSRTQLPPGQQLVAAGKWPIIGERLPAPVAGELKNWTLSIRGLVHQPLQLSLEQMLQRPLACHTIDIHCVTRWSKLGVTFEGIPLKQLIETAQPLPSAQFIVFRSHSPRKHSSSLALSTALSQETLIALKVDGQPLELEHGGPVREHGFPFPWARPEWTRDEMTPPNRPAPRPYLTRTVLPRMRKEPRTGAPWRGGGAQHVGRPTGAGP